MGHELFLVLVGTRSKFEFRAFLVVWSLLFLPGLGGVLSVGHCFGMVYHVYIYML